MKIASPSSILVVFVALVSGGWLVFSSSIASGQSQQEQRPPYQPMKVPSKHSGPLPKAEFGVTSTETAAEQTRRRSREIRRKNFCPVISDPGRPSGASEETTNLTIIDSVYFDNSDPAYPTTLSDAVIVGTVTSAMGFVSEDRTYVYSDFRIRVDEILKQDPAAKLAVGGHVVASRAGATVHFPSGHITHYLVLGQGMPKVSKQYLLFLWRPDPALPEYELLHRFVYELAAGQAFPLDDDHFYRKPEDQEATVLLAKVKKAIAALPK